MRWGFSMVSGLFLALACLEVSFLSASSRANRLATCCWARFVVRFATRNVSASLTICAVVSSIAMDGSAAIWRARPD